LDCHGLAMPLSMAVVRCVPTADADGDGEVSLADFKGWPDCRTGPNGHASSAACQIHDLDCDDDVDLRDYAGFQDYVSGHEGP
jgi:hypothetical protein